MRIIETIEELQSLIGQEVAVGDWFPVEQTRIDAFADATGDHQWIHQDVERAKTESPFGRTIAHGFLTLAMLPAMAEDALPPVAGLALSLNYGFDRVRFLVPVKAGARVRRLRAS